VPIVLGQREYAKLIKAAGVRPIRFHGLPHTCATLLLQANGWLGAKKCSVWCGPVPRSPTGTV